MGAVSIVSRSWIVSKHWTNSRPSAWKGVIVEGEIGGGYGIASITELLFFLLRVEFHVGYDIEKNVGYLITLELTVGGVEEIYGFPHI